MKTIADEIRDCLWLTRKRQHDLSVASGVSPQIISNLVTGRRTGVHGLTQDALRRGISILLEEYAQRLQPYSATLIGDNDLRSVATKSC